jgi:hypothetical protein
MKEILADGPIRERMLQGIAGVRASLRGAPGVAEHPADHAAEIILNIPVPQRPGV